MKRRIASWLMICLSLTALAALGGCSVDGIPVSTRGIEERVMQGGYANRMYKYAEDLYAQGYFKESMRAYLSAEQTAYTDTLREMSRKRRYYVASVLEAYEVGKNPPPPPLTPLQIQALEKEAARRRARAAQAQGDAKIRAIMDREAARIQADLKAKQQGEPSPPGGRALSPGWSGASGRVKSQSLSK